MARLLTCPQLATLTGYSRMQLVRWAQDDRIPGKRIITKGQQYRYEFTPELKEWIKNHKRKAAKALLMTGTFRKRRLKKVDPDTASPAELEEAFRDNLAELARFAKWRLSPKNPYPLDFWARHCLARDIAPLVKIYRQLEQLVVRDKTNENSKSSEKITRRGQV